MSRSLIAIVLFVAVTLSSSLRTIHVEDEQSVYVRFFPNFAQLFQRAKAEVSPSDAAREETQRYRFSFKESAYTQITEETLTMLNVDVTERTIVHHPMPNFEIVGARYFYRRDPKESEAVEIELINAEDRLFREVMRPNRVFYLTSYDNLEYTHQLPVMPFYEVNFACNVSRSNDSAKSVPLLSYADRRIQWTPRYTLDVRATPVMTGYADIRNTGEQTLMIEGLELVAGDVKLDGNSYDFLRSVPERARGYTDSISYMRKATIPVVRSMDKEASGTYVYETTVPSTFALAPRTTRSVQFFQANVTVDPFHYYSAEFLPVNARGKLLKSYNVTSQLTFVPGGRLSLYQENRFLGQTTLPDLAVNETHTVVLGYDADVSYERQVSLLEGDDETESVTYRVQYTFQNDGAMDARIYFVETFGSHKYFQVTSISQSMMDSQSNTDLQVYGTELRGLLAIPHQAGQKTISYKVAIFKTKPLVPVRQ